MANNLIKCGCMEHFIHENHDDVVEWKGQKWSAKCAFNTALKVIEQLKGGDKRAVALRKILEQKEQIIQKMECGMCGNEVGRNYHTFGSYVYCVSCSHGIGGEG